MRYALGIEYNGTHYHGWQRQAQSCSIQGELEKALSMVADEPIETQVAGRTDAGVHALGQVVHFDTNAVRPNKAWVQGVNTHLPDAIRVRWVCEVNDDFHARFSATARRYIYVLDNRKVQSAIWPNQATWFAYNLNETMMHQAAQYLLGEHDFSAFRAAGCQSKTPMRNVMHCDVRRSGDWVWVDIKANAFLHHMVRNILGSLLSVGTAAQTPEWFESIFQGRDRTQAAATASAAGLYLFEVDYSDQWQLPNTAMKFPWIPL